MNKKLEKAFKAVGGVYQYQAVMAYCLLSVNGEQNALDFIYGLRERRPTPGCSGRSLDHSDAKQLELFAAPLNPVS